MTSAREALGVAGIDVDDVAGGLRRKIRCEEIDRFGNIFREDVKLQHRTLAVMFLEIIHLDLR